MCLSSSVQRRDALASCTVTSINRKWFGNGLRETQSVVDPGCPRNVVLSSGNPDNFLFLRRERGGQRGSHSGAWALQGTNLRNRRIVYALCLMPSDVVVQNVGFDTRVVMVMVMVMVMGEQ